LAPLTAYTNHDGVIVGNGEDVRYEQSETWTFDTGEVAVLSCQWHISGPIAPPMAHARAYRPTDGPCAGL
jgi:hypothetical protein